MDKKDKLKKKINLLQNELYKIQTLETIERNKSWVGKYFTHYEDVSKGYTIYIACISINQFGWLMGHYFKIMENDEICFSKPDELVMVDHLIKEYSDETTKEEFLKIREKYISYL